MLQENVVCAVIDVGEMTRFTAGIVSSIRSTNHGRKEKLMSDYIITNGFNRGRRIDIFFTGIPDEQLRTEMKANKWQYYPKTKCWYNFFSFANEAQAEKYCKWFDENREISSWQEKNRSEQYLEYGNFELYEETDIDDWEEESILKRLGYSVSRNIGLSEEERQDIIFMAIHKHYITKDQVISFLKGMINTRSSRYCMLEAVSKWQSDLNYTRGL